MGKFSELPPEQQQSLRQLAADLAESVSQDKFHRHVGVPEPPSITLPDLSEPLRIAIEKGFDLDHFVYLLRHLSRDDFHALARLDPDEVPR